MSTSNVGLGHAAVLPLLHLRCRRPSLHSLRGCRHPVCSPPPVSTPSWHTVPMGLFDRFRRGARMRRPGSDTARTGSTTVRASDAADERHLDEFVTARRGVEGFVEPRTAVSDVTLLLVAHDGEWTRRRVPSVEWAHDVLQQAPGAVVRRCGGRRAAADARLQPPQEGRRAVARCPLIERSEPRTGRPTVLCGAWSRAVAVLLRTSASRVLDLSPRRARQRTPPASSRRSRCRRGSVAVGLPEL